MRVKGQIIKWDTIGRGGFNRTYVSKDAFDFTINGIHYHQRWILKVPMAHRDDDLNRKRVITPQTLMRLYQITPPYNHPLLL